MNKEEIYKLIKEKGYWHEITEHKAVFTMDEVNDFIDKVLKEVC